MVIPHSLFTSFDIDLFEGGHHARLYEKFGSHLISVNGKKGCYFAVYAPAASKVQVIGDFNGWKGSKHNLNVRWDQSGIWEGFIPEVTKGELYKYRIYSHQDGKIREKTDPYGRLYEMPPKTATVVWEDDYKWKDKKWLSNRSKVNHLDAPMSIYEVHLGSWRKSEDGSRSLHYDELATQLVNYVKEMNYTHVEMMPVMEHPYYPSWGYLSTGYFAPSSRYGDPVAFKLLTDKFHQEGIGVILDWVPAHFPSDEYALADFDGSALYEHPERSKGFHPDWNSLIFNYERPQVRSFLLSSATFWLDQYHADGLRVDAVASMLYLDYSRKDGEWSPNIYGGNEYLAAIDFLKELNTSVYGDFPDVQMIAEESMYEKMPGDDWQKMANIRLFYLLQYAHPGQKLLFMGCEIAQHTEWNVDDSLSWHLLENDSNRGVQNWVKDLNLIYRKENAFYYKNYTPEGFEWIDYSDNENTVLSLIRKSDDSYLVFVLNFSPVVRKNYRIGLLENKKLKEILNSDNLSYGGSGVINKKIAVDNISWHGKSFSTEINLPPLAGIILKPI